MANTTPTDGVPTLPAASAGEAEQDKPVSSSAVGNDDRLELICRAAYARYEKRGFENGHEEADWLAAEAQVDSAENSSDR